MDVKKGVPELCKYNDEQVRLQHNGNKRGDIKMKKEAKSRKHILFMGSPFFIFVVSLDFLSHLARPKSSREDRLWREKHGFQRTLADTPLALNRIK